MLHFDTDDLRDVFVYAMLDDYLKTCNHCPATSVSASGKPPKLTDAEVLFVFLIARLDLGGNCQQAEYFYGYKVHLITAAEVHIVEFDFTPGSVSDSIGFELLGFDLSAHSTVYADKAYNHYVQEDLLAEAAKVSLEPIRRSNSRRADNEYSTNWLHRQARRHVETDISQLVAHWPRRIHAVTARGFLLKVVSFIVAHHILFYF